MPLTLEPISASPEIARSTGNLLDGDRVDQPTFHAWYEHAPPDFRAELIGGVVSVASPVGPAHSAQDGDLIWLLGSYRIHTPGVKIYSNPTLILGVESELQPDAVLALLPEAGGRLRRLPSGLAGAPELVLEVADSSVSRDLHQKKRDYEAAGVPEYAVVLAREGRIVWFRLRGGGYEELPPGPDGIHRSEVFPGLWLDGAALGAENYLAALRVLEQGLASPEHAAFVSLLNSHV